MIGRKVAIGRRAGWNAGCRAGFVGGLALLTAQAAGQPVELRGDIEAVTVYRGEALVTRKVPVPAFGSGQGLRELVLTGLPEMIRPESLHAEGSGVLIRAVRFRTRPVTEDNREEVRALDAQILDLQRKIAANERKAGQLGEHRAYLASLQGFVAPTAQAELTRGVLNAQTLEQLTQFVRAQRDELVVQELALANEGQDLAAQLTRAQREREQISASSTRTVREAVVLVAPAGGSGGGGQAGTELRLRYLVGGATWSPSYIARREGAGAAATDAGMRLEYYAAVTQMSGEDWSGVTMTLSTATPSLTARAPRLEPIRLGLSSARDEQQAQGAYMQVRSELMSQQRELGKARASNLGGGAGDPGSNQAAAAGQADMDRGLNELARRMQVLDLTATGRVVRERADRMFASEEGLSVTYVIPGEATLPSRDDRQLVRIADLALPASYAKIAAPVLSEFVYDEAQATNASTMVLLAGPVTSYAGGAFVGGGELPTVAAGETFAVGFGNDSSLRTSRDLLERRESVQGGNRQVELSYRLRIENFGDAAANVRLLDRVPRVLDSQIKLTMLSGMPELSSDAEYQRQQKSQGILRWDVSVPANASGGRAFVLDYGFQLEHDRQMTLTGM